MSRRRSIHPVQTAAPKPSRRPISSRSLVLVAMVLITAAAAGVVVADWWSCLPDEATATYVGRQTCIQCHQQQNQLWTGSHHDLAMDHATPQTVLGDFDDGQLQHDGSVSRMFQRDGKYFIHTEGPDGQPADFEIKYVFGVEPLQQYMVEFDRPADMPPHEVARVQVLRVSWDTQRKEWFYLRPPDVEERLEPHDDLHWTGVAQRWNNMCADCHSTNLQKNYDARSKTYHTTFSEIDVSCETCHGPGSLHVQLAHASSLFWDRRRGYGLAKLKDKNPETELQTCFQCHSRRRVVTPDYRPGESYYDHFANELLLEQTYHADGQILDEVYEHGSFIQSKMYHKSIRCTDCHDPHTARLKHNGNQVCTSCHQHSPGKYDSPTHHRHDPARQGSSCVECHMPETTYMAVDARRDHSLRVPRPDLSVKLGTPNACSRCHLERAQLPDDKRHKLRQYQDWVIAARTDEDVRRALGEVDRWAAENFRVWWGEKPDLETHFANVLAVARRGEPEAEPQLMQLVQDQRLPGIVRATGLYELGQFPSRSALQVAAGLLHDDDPQVRAAAVENLQALNNNQRLAELLVPLLEDRTRLVRTEAARVLARVPAATLDGDERRTLKAALADFERGVMVNNDRAGAYMTMGVLRESQNDLESAQSNYETAIRIEPTVAGPRSNLAALLDRLADELEEQVRRRAQSDQEGAIHDAITAQKLRTRAQELRADELPLLARDAKLAPNSAAIQYRYGLSLYLQGKHAEAETALAAAARLEPHTPDFTLAWALLLRQLGRPAEAIPLLERVVELRPADDSLKQALLEARSEVSSTPPQK